MRHPLSTVLLGLATSLWVTGVAESAVNLVPHRAVYDLRLGSVTDSGGSNISGITGRMVFEITGAACEGYTVNSRFVVEQTDAEGRTTMTDLRASSFESGDSRSFDFLSQSYTNQVLVNDIKGTATSRNGSLSVELVSPKSGKSEIDRRVIFPTEHIITLIEAAREGKSIVTADVFDGSETGTKVYETTAVIGGAMTEPPTGTAEKISTARRWPVTVSYFDAEGSGDQTPDYAVTFEMWENGVSTDILMDYGDFSLTGTLSSYEALEPAACE